MYDIELEVVDSLHFCETTRKISYIHNLLIGNKIPLSPLTQKTIFGDFPYDKKWWPLWDPIEKLSCLLAPVSSAMLIGRIHCALARSSDAPYLDAQKYVSRE
jgi:hypothetical protein